MLKKLLAALAVAFVLGVCQETPPPTPAVRNFVVFFNFDRSTLTPRAMDIVREAASAAKAGQTARVTCTGHTDTAGAASMGVPAPSIAVDAKGETSPRVQTPDDVREPQNRRVDIVIE